MNSSAQSPVSPDKLRASFGETILHFRDARDWGRSKLARVSGVSRSQIRAYENGEQWAMARNLSRILNALEVSAADFFEMVKTRLLLDSIALVQEGGGEDVSFDDGGDAKSSIELRLLRDVSLRIPAELFSLSMTRPKKRPPDGSEQ